MLQHVPAALVMLQHDPNLSLTCPTAHVALLVPLCAVIHGCVLQKIEMTGDASDAHCDNGVSVPVASTQDALRYIDGAASVALPQVAEHAPQFPST